MITKAILTIVGVALFFGFIALGTWQVQRRAWKLDLIEQVDKRLHSAPVALSQVGGTQPSDEEVREHEYQPVFVEGRWLADKTVFSQALSVLGSGFWVITPIEQADGTQVLINRGFIPEAQRRGFNTAMPDTAAVRVQGLLRKTEPGGGFLRKNDEANDKWHSRDVQAMASAMGLSKAAPYFIDLGIPDVQVNVEGPTPSMQGEWPRPGLTVVKFPNSHAVYMLTWYGLALMVLVAAYFVIRHERRKA